MASASFTSMRFAFVEPAMAAAPLVIFPVDVYSSSSFFVLSFDSCTLGWSNGLTPMIAPATAVALLVEGVTVAD